MKDPHPEGPEKFTDLCLSQCTGPNPQTRNRLPTSTLLFHVTQHLLYTKWRAPDEEPKLHLFGQLKRLTKQWLDTCLVCKGGTYPAQLMYQELADMACNKITAGITRALEGKRPIKALLDPYNPTGSSAHVRFNTSRTARWETSSKHCHVNWLVLDSDWEAEFCRVAESHPKVRAYVKNHNLGLEVPYRYGSEIRKYLPDFLVLVDDGHGPDVLHPPLTPREHRSPEANSLGLRGSPALLRDSPSAATRHPKATNVHRRSGPNYSFCALFIIQSYRHLSLETFPELSNPGSPPAEPGVSLMTMKSRADVLKLA